MSNQNSHFHQIPESTLDLNRRPGVQPFRVDMQSFFEFSFWLAEELLDLEALHSSKVKQSPNRDANILAFARKFNLG